MKLGCAISTYQTDFNLITLRDGDLAKDLELMKKYGFEGIDLFIKKSTKEDIALYKKMIHEMGMSVSALFAIYLGESGVKMTEKDPVLRQRNIDLVKEQLDNAKELGAIGLGMGYIRGRHDEDETEAEALKRVASALHEVGEYAESIGSTILLEPVNRYEINTLNSAVQTVDFIKENDLKGITLQLDMFHMHIEDKSLPYAIEYSKGLISNLHISSSNRHDIGTGHFDFKETTDALRKVGYDGYLTLEAITYDAERTLKTASEALRQYL